MGEPLLGTSSLVHYIRMDDKLQPCDISVMLLLNLHKSTLMTITMWCHPLWVIRDLSFDASLLDRYLAQVRPWEGARGAAAPGPRNRGGPSSCMYEHAAGNTLFPITIRAPQPARLSPGVRKVNINQVLILLLVYTENVQCQWVWKKSRHQKHILEKNNYIKISMHKNNF